MSTRKRAWVAATLDTKLDEAEYVCDLLEAARTPCHIWPIFQPKVLLAVTANSSSIRMQTIGT